MRDRPIGTQIELFKPSRRVPQVPAEVRQKLIRLLARRLVARDLARPETATHVDRIFDLGSSGGSDMANQRDSMIAEAFLSTRRKLRRR